MRLQRTSKVVQRLPMGQKKINRAVTSPPLILLRCQQKGSKQHEQVTKEVKGTWSSMDLSSLLCLLTGPASQVCLYFWLATSELSNAYCQRSGFEMCDFHQNCLYLRFYHMTIQGSFYYQPKQCTINGKSLKFTIHLQCLIPPNR